MAVITLRISDGERAALDSLARSRQTTMSDLLREAVETLLGRDVDGQRPEVPRGLDMTHRQILTLLHQVLGHLEEEGEAGPDQELPHHAKQVEVLQEGYTAEYADEFIALERELTRSQCELVWDILDMFTILETSADHLGKEAVAKVDEHAAHALRFQGFDLNDRVESRLLGYVRHLVRTGRWENLQPHLDRAHDRGNSHSRKLPTYERMLAAYKPIWARKIAAGGFDPDKLRLSAEELGEVFAAWPYPGQ